MKLLVIDSNSILNRAFYGIKLLSNQEGLYTNGIFGYINIVSRMLEDLQPDCVACAFDLKAPTFRHEKYDGYKANRKGMPPELFCQLAPLKELLDALGYAIVEREGYEADDILGTLAKDCGEQSYECVLATGDRDSLQLVSGCTTVLLATTKMGAAQYTPWTPETVQEHYGVTPKELIEVKALMGDSSDNIPGVAGVGEKTALSLIQQFHTLQNLYDNLDSQAIRPAVRKKLEAGRDMAFLSRELAEIFCDVPIDQTVEHYRPRPRDNDRAYRLLAKLEMFSTIKKLGLTPPVEGLPQVEAAPVQEQPLVCAPLTQGDLDALLEKGEPVDLLANWTGEEPEDFALIQGDRLWYVPQGEEQHARWLTQVLCDPIPKRVDQSKFYYKYTARQDLQTQGICFDLPIAGYLLSPNSTDYQMEHLAGERDMTPRTLQGDCPVEGAGLFSPLCDRLAQELQANGQEELFQRVELPLAQVLASMEVLGFAVDVEGIRSFGEQINGDLEQITQHIYELAGETFNINSPKQLGEILFGKLGLPARKKTKSGYSTNVDVLESLKDRHPIVREILEYRKLAKLSSTYVEGLLKVVGADGRIHSSFNQTETRTGRISSAEPNMQNIPVRTELGSNMRRFFVARPGCLLVDADYSQIELRVLAHIAQDENMIAAFRSGQDIHTTTAAQVFHLPPEFVTPLLRSRAKAVNFGIVYGIGAYSLSQDIGVSVAEADQYIKSYLDTYSGVKRYMEETVQRAKEQGYVTTLLNRRRYLPELKSSNHNLKAFGQRVAMNTPIQGTAADIIKIAMVRVYHRLKEEGLRAKLILQVHDELIVEAPLEEVQQVKALVKEEMEHAMDLSVELKVDVNTGESWYEAK